MKFKEGDDAVAYVGEEYILNGVPCTVLEAYNISFLNGAERYLVEYTSNSKTTQVTTDVINLYTKEEYLKLRLDNYHEGH